MSEGATAQKKPKKEKVRDLKVRLHDASAREQLMMIGSKLANVPWWVWSMVWPCCSVLHHFDNDGFWWIVVLETSGATGAMMQTRLWHRSPAMTNLRRICRSFLRCRTFFLIFTWMPLRVVQGWCDVYSRSRCTIFCSSCWRLMS